MDILEAGLIRNLVITYVAEKYDLEIGPLQEDTSEILIHKFYNSLYLLFQLDEDKKAIINSYIERCKLPILNIELFNIIYDFWLGENIEESLMEELLSTYKQIILHLLKLIVET